MITKEEEQKIKQLIEGLKLGDLDISPHKDSGLFIYHNFLGISYTGCGTSEQIKKELQDELSDLWEWLKKIPDNRLGNEPLKIKRFLEEELK